jgi:GT2 family glycosyltransferase
LLLINPDAVVEPGAVSALIAALDMYPKLAVAGGHIQEDHWRSVSAWAYPSPGRTIAGSVIGLGRAYRTTVDDTNGDGVKILRDSFVPLTFAILRRTAFDQLGGLDEDFWLYGEDADYCYRAERAGWQIGMAAEARATHVGRASSTGATNALAWQLANEDRFRLKHFGRAASWAAGTALTFGAIGRLAILLLMGRLGRPNPTRTHEWLTVLTHYRRHTGQ